MNLYRYDLAGQLTNEVVSTNGLSSGVTNTWVYDEAGNWLGSLGAAAWRGYNADNELVGVATNTVTVTGEVDAGPNSNKWYNSWATCRGVSAQVSQSDGTFSLANVPLHPGTNALVVQVTDVSDNWTQQVRHVVNQQSMTEQFAADGNGNLTCWVEGDILWGYEWDWADRLVKVTSNSVVVLENWYDASGRRIAKKDGTNYAMYVWDGWASVALLATNGPVLETYTRGVGLAGDIGTLVAVTHHAASFTNGTFYAHGNHRGDIVLTRSGTTTVGGYSYSAFGLQTSAFGPDVCRFKFSSKERDAATGFSYYGYRFYAPLWQRWLSRDPIGDDEGVNLYSFAYNNPAVRLDPFGLETFTSEAGFEMPPGGGATSPGSQMGPLSSTGSGNNAVCHPPPNPCTLGDYGPVERFQKQCPNGTTVTCRRWKRCEAAGKVPTKGSESRIEPVTQWVTYERCPPCP